MLALQFMQRYADNLYPYKGVIQRNSHSHSNQYVLHISSWFIKELNDVNFLKS